MARTYEIACQKEIIPLYVDIKKALDKGRLITVEVKSKATKTKEQLGYYWEVVLPRVREGLMQDGNELSLVETNQFLNEKFFYKIKTITWKVGNDEHLHTILAPRSKSGATKDEMSEFLDKVIRWAQVDLGVEIPLPVRDTESRP